MVGFDRNTLFIGGLLVLGTVFTLVAFVISARGI
jgi:hypothetical protein